MKEVLYKRELLTQVVQEFHLYGYEKETATTELDDAVTCKMRGVVQFEHYGSPLSSRILRRSRAGSGKRRDDRLTELFIQENVKSREVIATSSTEFLQHELDVMKAQLELKERALAQFKQTYLGQLPNK